MYRVLLKISPQLSQTVRQFCWIFSTVLVDSLLLFWWICIHWQECINVNRSFTDFVVTIPTSFRVTQWPACSLVISIVPERTPKNVEPTYQVRKCTIWINRIIMLKLTLLNLIILHNVMYPAKHIWKQHACLLIQQTSLNYWCTMVEK